MERAVPGEGFDGFGSALRAIEARCQDWRARLAHRVWHYRENLPRELRGGRLVLSEVRLWIDHPIPLVGQPDQVLENDRGELVLVDTKVRQRIKVRLADVLGLSAYRVLLLNSTHPAVRGRQVARHGYVRLVINGVVQYARVDLMSTSAVVIAWMKLRRFQEFGYDADLGLSAAGVDGLWRP